MENNKIPDWVWWIVIIVVFWILFAWFSPSKPLKPGIDYPEDCTTKTMQGDCF